MPNILFRVVDSEHFAAMIAARTAMDSLSAVQHIYTQSSAIHDESCDVYLYPPSVTMSSQITFPSVFSGSSAFFSTDA
jgi:hypothetical protein